jgi:Asp-tRNA(Asn)/Glu-tRNA(Gln) amidotransferase A subunit family amidase
MTRTVEDAALMFDVMEGHDPRDPFSLPDSSRDFVGATQKPIADLKIGYSPTLGGFPVSETVRGVMEEAVSTLKDAGVTVERTEPSFGVDHATIIEAYYRFVRVRWEALFDSLEDEGFDPRGTDKSRLGNELVEVVLEADPVSTREYKQAEVTRTAVLDGINDVLSSFDAIVTPTTSIIPFKHGEFPTEIDGHEIEPRRGWLLTQPCNFTGHPTASIPAGFTNGLPVGMQIISDRYADDMVFRVSAGYERLQPWIDQYPN